MEIDALAGYRALQALKLLNIMPVILTCQPAFALTGQIYEVGGEEISDET